MMGVAMVAKDEEFSVMLVVQYVAYLRPSELCDLDGRSGHPASARVWREQSGSLLSSSGRV